MARKKVKSVNLILVFDWPDRFLTGNKFSDGTSQRNCFPAIYFFCLFQFVFFFLCLCSIPLHLTKFMIFQLKKIHFISDERTSLILSHIEDVLPVKSTQSFMRFYTLIMICDFLLSFPVQIIYSKNPNNEKKKKITVSYKNYLSTFSSHWDLV